MSFSYRGRQVRRSTETADKKLAQRIFDKIKGEMAEGKWFERLPGEDYTFRDLCEKYLKEYSAPNKAPRSHQRDKSLCNHLLASFGDVPVLELAARDVAAYKHKRREGGAAPRTINYELVLMGHMFNVAMREWEWLKDNPVKRVSKEKVRGGIERWLSPQEEARLMLACPQWLKDIVVFAIHTGFRESEILDLQWFQIDMDRRTVTLYRQKNGGVDTLPLNRTMMRLLMLKARSPHSDETLVFPSASGTRILHRNLFRAFKGALERAGIKRFRFHDLRHTFATRLVQNGVDLFTVQKLGRWKTTSMVMRYAHHYPESLRPGIEVMDRIASAPGEFSTILAQSEKKEGHKPFLRLVTH